MSLRRSLAAALTAALAFAPSASASGGLSLFPSQVDIPVRTGSEIKPVALHNGSRRTVSVRVGVASLSQAPTGLAVFDTTRAGRARAARLISVRQRRLTLRPGATARIGARVLRRPGPAMGAYASITFTARPVHASAKDISPALVLGANLLLRFPGRFWPQMNVEALHPQQTAPRKLGVRIDVSNHGNVHAKARRKVVLSDHRGAVLEEDRLIPANVLPGATRIFQVPIRRSLPAGQYWLRAGKQRVSFTLVARDTLPTPKLAFDRVIAPRTDADHRFQLPVGVRSEGNTLAHGRVVARMRDRAGHVFGTSTVAIPDLQPGTGATRRIGLPGVPEGAYRISLHLDVAGGTSSDDSVEFATHAQPGLVDRIRDWLAGQNLGLLAVIGTLVVLLGAMARRMRRLSRLTKAARYG